MSVTWFILFVCVVGVVGFDGVSGSLVIKPENTVVLAGQSARFNCSSTDGNGSTIYWGNAIFADDIVPSGTCLSQLPLLYTGILHDSSCDMVVMPSIAVMSTSYGCADETGGLLATLIVLDSAPTCVPNPTDKTLVCNGDFRCVSDGAHRPSAWISCNGLGDGPVTTYETDMDPYPVNETVFDLPATVDPSYNCQLNVKFSDYYFFYARNVAIYEFTSQTIVPMATTAKNPPMSNKKKCHCRRVGRKRRCVCRRHRNGRNRCSRVGLSRH